MKRLTYTIFTIVPVFLFSVQLMAQQTDETYQIARAMLNTNGSSYVDVVRYYNGLGLPTETVIKGVTPTGANLASIKEYDGCGRISKEWLARPTGAAYTSPTSLKTSITSYYSDTRPYTVATYEVSPLGRPYQIYSEGAAWASHPTTMEYHGNTASGIYLCLRYTVNADGSLVANGHYPAGTLTAVRSTDPDGAVTILFTDFHGREILTRKVNGSTSLDTYYVYDDYGLLRYVLEPMYQQEASLTEYAYTYSYDSRNRCIEIRRPGRLVDKYVYDNANKLIFSQDGRQRNTSSNLWGFYLYDKYGREVVHGECSNSNTASVSSVTVTTTFSTTSTGIGGSGYTSSFSLTSPVLHTATYYDTYTFLSRSGFTDRTVFQTGTTSGTGLPTGTLRTVFGATTKIYGAIYYDEKGRISKRVETNLSGGYDTGETTYTFTDKPQTETVRHYINGSLTNTELITYTYDGADRLLTTSHKINSQTAVTIASNTYDELCRLYTHIRNGNSTLTDTYTYNIQGALTKISGTKFTQNIYYNSTLGTARYGGDISGISWKSGGESTLRSYKYTYDGYGRLASSVYAEGSSYSTNMNRYSENIIQYDNNGNINGLVRYGKKTSSTYGVIDNLTITHTGNKLKSVSDAADAPSVTNPTNFTDGASNTQEYAYDGSGNLTRDDNRGITDITYNSLNLPSMITSATGSTIRNLYRADGQKLRSIHTASSGIAVTTDYVANTVYQDGTLKMIRYDGGYATMSGSTPSYHFYLRDYLGSNRVVTSATGTVEQVIHYYPFGGEWADATNTDLQSFKYTGKELDKTSGLNLYDYGARHYDPSLCCWDTQDPKAEKYYGISGYCFCAGNPVKYVDPDGRDVRVAKEYQEQFINDLQSVFGDRINMLSFSDNGTLQLEESAKDFIKKMTKNQKEAFEGLYKAMRDRQVTSVVYADNYDITVGNEIKSVNIVREYGGGVYYKTGGVIVIAPNVGSIDVTLDQIQITSDGLGFPTQNVKQNTTSTLFHEIGERNIANINYRGNVIDFENYARRVIGLPVRPYDLNHSKTIKTSYTK